ncbi:MAG: hypothetical protein H0V85_04750 [Thermoleophilaceae bacterium]|jgi:hypothetical protein|nr:hypothetical protein [Thermoleophilaceae bacterium]
MIVFIIFAVVAITFGYALAGWSAYLALLPPIILFLIGIFQAGFDGAALLELVIAIVVVLIGIAVGRLIAARLDSDDSGERASA